MATRERKKQQLQIVVVMEMTSCNPTQIVLLVMLGSIHHKYIPLPSCFKICTELDIRRAGGGPAASQENEFIAPRNSKEG